MKNITGITNINSLLNTMKMQHLWEMRKQDPERARIEKEQKQKQISQKISDIRTKLKFGKKLTDKELRLLREHAPELYKKAEAVQQERKNFKEALKNCKTKDDVQRLFSQKMQFSMSIAKQDQEMAEYLTSALQEEHTHFTKTDSYKDMKWETELTTEKTEKTSKNKKSTKTNNTEKIYQSVLKRAEQVTAEYDISEDGTAYKKEQTISSTEQNTKATIDTSSATFKQAYNNYQSLSETTETKSNIKKRV
ncbi:hypothetical protein [Clostridium sp. MD294]|uniref:hypothetical protein n=1 Tax=Clostridium sp. MD294 TaxID=97138 RepID=UPI0002CBE050|nr:hypothetical protein [Clostridium sp. MD294]NDO45613.1 hypothetical protein [Clostridium sp. MD294]USF30733.1 hypothetical protein C820_002176 [Clostridium sp. MD294]